MQRKATTACLSIAALIFAGVLPARAALVVSSGTTQNISCTSGVCTATAKHAVLNARDLQNLLTSGDAAVKTGGGAQDIDLRAPLSWASTSRLTLDAHRSVEITRPVSITGQGALTVTTNDGGKNGDLDFLDKGRVSFANNSSSLIINGNAYALFSDIYTLASIIYGGSGGHYALARSYDASGDGGYDGPLSDLPFEGTLEGLGNAFDHVTLYFEQDEPYDGLISVIGGTVRDLGLTHADVEGYEYIITGMLAGVNDGTVKNCWTSGIFNSGTAAEGALVGVNAGVVVDSHTDVHAYGYSDNGLDFGGIAGENDGVITGSYALGGMTFGGNTSSDAGGLVGLNKGAIVNSYTRNRLDGTGQAGGSTLGGLVGTNMGTVQASYAAGRITPGAEANLGGLIGADNAAKKSLIDTYWDLNKGVSDPAKGAGNKAHDPGITGLTTAQFKAALPQGFDPKAWTENPSINKGYPYLIANPPKK